MGSIRREKKFYSLCLSPSWFYVKIFEFCNWLKMLPDSKARGI